MRVRMKVGKDVYYAGEITDLPANTAMWWIQAGYAEEVKGGCPECGAPVPHEGGCISCYQCGWSKCG